MGGGRWLPVADPEMTAGQTARRTDEDWMNSRKTEIAHFFCWRSLTEGVASCNGLRSPEGARRGPNLLPYYETNANLGLALLRGEMRRQAMRCPHVHDGTCAIDTIGCVSWPAPFLSNHAQVPPCPSTALVRGMKSAIDDLLKRPIERK
jgi:hypothetical protein